VCLLGAAAKLYKACPNQASDKYFTTAWRFCQILLCRLERGLLWHGAHRPSRLDADKTCTATFSYPVGGVVVPVNRVGLLVPWLGLVALIAIGGMLLRARRRT
jgi:hypothetical protein